MGLRWTEEDLKLYRARQQRQALSPDVKVAQLRGSDLSGIANEKTPRVEHHDEIDAWAYAIQHGNAINPKAGVLPKPEPRSKYGNRRVEIDGMKFDSQKEANYYFGTLLPAWKCGAYKLLARQVPFDLPGGIKYIADFVTVSADGYVSVIDAKSEATRKNRVYINKKKQMKAIWRIEIVEV